jgi:hypothetical protein
MSGWLAPFLLIAFVILLFVLQFAIFPRMGLG